jgi:DNA repair exonuclease SbcCD ATPase subunit
VTTSRITELETEAKANEWVLQADEILQKLEAYETRCTEIAQATHKLTELVDRLESSQAQIQKLQTVVDDFQPLVTVYAAQDGIQRQYTRLDTILSSYPDVRPIRAIVRDFEPVQETYKTADTLRQQHSRLASLLTTIPETIPTQDEIDMIQKRLQYCKTVSEGHRRLTEFINQCEDYESQIHALSQDLRATKQQLHEQSEGVCPICRSPLPS